jgi:hypothetical protein
MNSKKIWKEAVVTNLRYDPGVFLEGLRKTMKYVRLAGLWSEI